MTIQRTGSGKRARMFVIEDVTKTLTDEGDTTEVWSEYAKAWVWFRQITGREREWANQTVPDATHKVTMRYLSGVNETMRGKLDGKTYYFERVDDRDASRTEMDVYLKLSHQSQAEQT